MANFFVRNKEQHSLVIDIGSGSVGLALVQIRPNTVPLIKYAIRQELPLQKKPTSSRLLHLTLGVLRALMEQYHKGSHPRPDQIHCFLSPHLSVSQTRIIKMQFDDARLVDRSVIDNMIEGELTLFKAEHADKYGSKPALIDNKIMSVKLNGYPVSEIDSRRVRQVELAVSFGLTTSNIENELKREVADSFHRVDFQIHSFLFANFAVARDVFKGESSFVLMDIGSEISDLSIIKDSILESSTSFPLGKNALIRQILSGSGEERLIVDSLLNTYGAGHLEVESVKLLQKEFEKFGKEWIRQMSVVIENITRTERLPQSFYLLADHDVSSIFQNYLASMKLSGVSLLNRNPDVKIISDSELAKFYENKSDLFGDVFLGAEAIFTNKVFNYSNNSL